MRVVVVAVVAVVARVEYDAAELEAASRFVAQPAERLVGPIVGPLPVAGRLRRPAEQQLARK